MDIFSSYSAGEFLSFKPWGKNILSLYRQKLSRLLGSFLLSALSIKVTLQSSIPLCSGSLKCWWKCSWLTFGGLPELDNLRIHPYSYYKSTAIISYIASYVLFRTRATMKFLKSKICVAINTNIVLTPISVFKLICVINIVTNLAMFTFLSDTLRLFGIC